MKNMKFRRIFAGACVATMLITTPAMAEQTGTKELTEAHDTDSTTVKAHIAGADDVTYVIQIPEVVDFGTLKQPNSPGVSYATEQITVKCTQLDGLQSGQALAVMVKDSEAQENSDPFKLKKTDNEDAVLTYNILNHEGNNVQDLHWYTNGFLFNAFTGAGQEATDTLRLDCGQLYGKDLAVYGGDYEGTLNFHSTIASINDVSGN